jgi:hypothetical protein
MSCVIAFFFRPGEFDHANGVFVGNGHMSGHDFLAFRQSAMAGALEISYIIRAHTQTAVSGERVARTALVEWI